MAQSGYTPISLYYSATGAAVPSAGNLVAGELALNTNDGKLYFKNSAGVVTLLAGSTSGPAGGSTTQVQYNNAGVLAGITGATTNGTALTLVAPNLGSPNSVGTMPAFTLGGTVSGGGNQINNVVIGTTTPLAGAFTTLSATDNISATKSINSSLAATLTNVNGGVNASADFAANNGSYTGYFGIIGTAGTTYGGRVASDTYVYSSTNIAIQADNASGTIKLCAGTGGATKALVSSTGLAVTGTLSATGTITSGVTANAVLESTNTSTSRKYIEIGNTSGDLTIGVESSAGGTLVVGAAAYSAVVGTPLAKSLHLFTNNTARLTIDSAGAVTIGGTLSGGTSGTGYSFSGSAPATSLTLDSSGNLGLGVTPSAWSSASRPALQLTNGAALFTRTGATALGQNFFYNSSDIGSYIANGYATLYYQSSGQHIWFNAANNSSGAGATASLSQAMTLDASGILTISAYGAGAATFSAAGVISSVSDETWKIKDGVPVDTDAMLKKLEPGYWYYNDEKKETFGSDRQLGFYAQNVNAAIGPEAAPTPETITTPVGKLPNTWRNSLLSNEAFIAYETTAETFTDISSAATNTSKPRFFAIWPRRPAITSSASSVRDGS